MYKQDFLEFELSKLNCSNIIANHMIDFNELRKMLTKDFHSEIVSFLNQYHNSDNGTVNHFGFSDEYKTIDNKVIISVIYDVTYYNGCKDIDSTDEDIEMNFEISINPDKCILTIKGDKIYERDPDEY